MIIDLKPYPKMKDSGVEWLGKVPEHWKIKRLKSSVNNVIQQTVDHQKSDLYVAMEHVESWTGRLILSGTGVSFDSQLKRFRPGDVLFGKLRPYLAKVTRPLSYGVCVGEFLVLRPRNSRVTSPFLEQMLRSKPFIDAVNISTFGAKMPRADWRFIGGMAIGRPPLPEQTAIVRFLDHADRRIRRYIRAKQKMVALLEEQKQTIIHQAVTGQIDVRSGQPYAAYKPSGMAWLGDVPQHWDVEPAKWYFREADDRSETGSEELLSVSHITGVTPRSEKNVTMFKAESSVGYKLCRPGDVVINTMWAWMAALGIARQTGIVSPSYAVYRPHSSSRLQGDYTDLLLRTRAYKSEYVCRSTGIRSSRLRLYPEDFLRIKLLGPPHDEQRRIVEFVNSRSAMANSSIHRTRDKITLLKEYRTRLIADVVTGKLDVRKAVACLPDETETSQAMDRPDAHLLSTRT